MGDFVNTDIELRAKNKHWYDGVELYARMRSAQGEYAVALPLEFKLCDPGIVSQPIATLSRNEAQTLMNDLWHCGYRPSNGEGSVGQLRATQRHLEDMRRLVFEGQESDPLEDIANLVLRDTDAND